MMKKKIIGICIVFVGLLACEKDHLPFYEGGSGLYFKQPENGVIHFSFVDFPLDELRDTILKIPVYLLGPAFHEPIRYQVIVDDQSTAVAGRDYEQFSAEQQFEADSLVDTLYIQLKRSEILMEDTVSLLFSLRPGPQFQTRLEYDPAVQNTTTIRLQIDDFLPVPGNWETLSAYFGTFSQRKIRIILSFFDGDYPYRDLYASLDYLNNEEELAQLLKDYLEAQKAAGTPVYEADGTEMEVGPLYQ